MYPSPTNNSRFPPLFFILRLTIPGYAALKQHEKTIEDASAALTLNPDYSKALRRRAHAYEEIQADASALSDWTAACILEEFRFADATDSVQRVLKRLAETQASEKLALKTRKLPSPNFVLAYLQSFRPKPWPTLTEPLSEGDRALKKAFDAVDAVEFDRASEEFEKAIRLGCRFMPLALNYSGTFSFIRGDTDVAIEEFNRSLELDPKQAQVWAKRASVHMEKSTTPLPQPKFPSWFHLFAFVHFYVLGALWD
jgi:mitochondrial import receptor subunit TOM70